MKLNLYRQDIEYLEEVSKKGALTIMRDIREDYGLPKKRYVSVNLYCDFCSKTKEDVWRKLKLLKDKKP